MEGFYFSNNCDHGGFLFFQTEPNKKAIATMEGFYFSKMNQTKEKETENDQSCGGGGGGG
jgi:hypothetical protein